MSPLSSRREYDAYSRWISVVVVVMLCVLCVLVRHSNGEGAPCNPIRTAPGPPAFFSQSWQEIGVDPGNPTAGPKYFDHVLRFCNGDNTGGATYQSLSFQITSGNAYLALAGGSNSIVITPTPVQSVLQAAPPNGVPTVSCNYPWSNGATQGNCRDLTVTLQVTQSATSIGQSASWSATAVYVTSTGTTSSANLFGTFNIRPLVPTTLTSRRNINLCTTAPCNLYTLVGSPFQVYTVFSVAQLVDTENIHLNYNAINAPMSNAYEALQPVSLLDNSPWVDTCNWQTLSSMCGSASTAAGEQYASFQLIAGNTVGTFTINPVMVHHVGSFYYYNQDYATTPPLTVTVRPANYIYPILSVTQGSSITIASGGLLDFGTITPMDGAVTLSITLNNVGTPTATLAATALTAPWSFVTPPASPSFSISGSGGTKAFSIVFTPTATAPGVYTQSLTFTACCGATTLAVDNTPYTITFKATVLAPLVAQMGVFVEQQLIASAQPATICGPPAANSYTCTASFAAGCVCFGAIEVGEPLALNIDIRNLGVSVSSSPDISVSTITATAPYTVMCTGSCNPFISAGQSYYFVVSVNTAAATSGWIAGTLTIAYNSGLMYTLNLMARVVAVTPSIVTSPVSYGSNAVGTSTSGSAQFCNTMGSATTNAILTLAPNPTTYANVPQALVSGVNYVLPTAGNPTVGQTVAFGGCQTITALFQPTTTGFLTDNVVVFYTTGVNQVIRSTSPAAFQLQGTGTPSSLSLYDDSTGAKVAIPPFGTDNWGQVPYNQPNTHAFELDTTAPGNILSLTIVGSTDFTISTQPMMGFTTGGVDNFAITFRPTTFVTQTATLQLTFQLAGSPTAQTNLYTLTGDTSPCTVDASVTLTSPNINPVVPQQASFTVTAAWKSFVGIVLAPYVTISTPASFNFVAGTPSCGTYSAATQQWSLGTACASGATLTFTGTSFATAANPTATVTATIASNCVDSNNSDNTMSLTFAPTSFTLLTPASGDRIAMYFPLNITWTSINPSAGDTNIIVQIYNTRTNALVPAFSPYIARVSIYDTFYYWHQGPHRLLPGKYQIVLTATPSMTNFPSQPIVEVYIAPTKS